jgi:hypothetical protein
MRQSTYLECPGRGIAIDEREKGERVSASVLTERHRFESCNLHVPKPRSTEKRTITIPSPIDRVLHRSITSALEDIFEPVFLLVYYGFRHYQSVPSLF